MHLTLDSIIRRLLVYRLMRYRFAWLAFGLVGLYLAAVLVLVIYSQRQVSISGAMTACRSQPAGTNGQVTESFSLREHPGLALELTAANFSPTLPALCGPRDQSARLRYETNALREPNRVDEVTLVDTRTGAEVVYRDRTRADFEVVKQTQLVVFGGGMALVSVFMLIVGAFWPRFADAAKKTRPTRRRERPSLIPTHFTAQVGSDMRWLAALPWGVNAGADHRSGHLAFQRGVALVRGWDGDEETLTRGVGLLVHCPPALAYTGAAEAALQLASYDVLSYDRAGLGVALGYVGRALELAPASVDARLTRIHVLAAFGSMGDTERLAQAIHELRGLREDAARHRRLPSAMAAVAIARRDYKQATVALRKALAVTPNEEERAALLDTLARVLLRAGDLREALRLFVTLSLPDVAEQGVPLSAGQRRLSQSAPLPAAHNAATFSYWGDSASCSVS